MGKGGLANEFSWSVSQNKKFSECRRMYYYSRYGSWGGWMEPAGSRTREIYLLKNLARKNEWVGTAVHGLIGTSLRHLKNGRVLPFVKAERFLEEGMRADFLESRGNGSAFHKNPKRTTRFFEHEYSLEFPTAEAEALIGFAKKCLKNFYESETYARLKTVRGRDWLAIDEKEPGKLDFEGTTVFVKLDAAVRMGEKILVFDWKTGRKEDVDYTDQMGCYLLYAVRTWQARPEDVDVFEVNLASNRVKKHAGLGARIDWLENNIRNSVAAFKTLLRNPEENIAAEEDYPKANELRYCRNCGFVRVCKPGVLPDGTPIGSARCDPPVT